MRIQREAAPAVPLAWEARLIPSGPDEAARLAAQGWLVSIREFRSGADAAQWRDANVSPEARRGAERDATLLALPQTLLPPLVARSWRPGDKMRPNGLNGTKKLQDLFTDSKIRASVRNRYPVVADAGGGGEIFAVVGLRAGENTLDNLPAFPDPLWLLQWDSRV